MEETSRAGRREIEAVVEETNRNVETLKGRIGAEKESAASLLRAQVSFLSTEIARKVLGRPVA
jgi:F0F1-type ATP synthase membrane subunit b/b'